MNARLTATLTLFAVLLMVLSIGCNGESARPVPTSTNVTPVSPVPTTPVKPIPTPADPTTPVSDVRNEAEVDMEALMEAQAELDKHRVLWEANRAEDYSFVLTPICHCPQDVLDPVTIHVTNGVVASVTYVASGEAPEHDGFGRYVTIDALFDKIQGGIDDMAPEVTVTYDPETGYPTDANIDYDSRMADEEYRFTASGYSSGG